MLRFFIPGLLILAGIVLIADPIAVMAGCGIGSYPVVPGKCNPPRVVGPSPSPGYCVKQGDGSCLSVNCNREIWDNALPGLCENAVITEYGIPVCTENWAATAITVNGYQVSCAAVAGNCSCNRVSNGQTTTITVCNCKDGN
jgi:hypothetical protein